MLEAWKNCKWMYDPNTGMFSGFRPQKCRTPFSIWFRMKEQKYLDPRSSSDWVSNTVYKVLYNWQNRTIALHHKRCPLRTKEVQISELTNQSRGSKEVQIN